MSRLAAVLLVACGTPMPPAPQCVAPLGAGAAYPLTVAVDGATEHVSPLSAGVAAGPVLLELTARIRNAPGNAAGNVLELSGFVASCDGRYLGSVAPKLVDSASHAGTWQTIGYGVDLTPFPDAAQLVLLTVSLHGAGQQLVDVEGFGVAP